MKIRNVLSCFDGISAGIVALQRAGIEFDNYYAFEIDKFAIKCSTENHPNIIQLGDINNWEDNIIEDVDLIIGGFACFVEDTLILTKQGYKEIKDIVIGDEVLSHTGDWRKVIKTNIRENVPTRVLKGYGCLNIETTDEHPFYTRGMYRKYHREGDFRTMKRLFSEPSWTEAKNIKPKETYLSFVKSVDNVTENNYNFWYMIGRYTGDGYYRKTKRKHRKNSYSYIFNICCGKHELKELKEIFDNSGYYYAYDENRTTYLFRICDMELVSFVEAIGKGASNKIVHPKLWGESIENKKAYLEGLFSADGFYCNKTKKQNLSTTSKLLAYGVQQLIVDCYDRPARFNFCKRPPTCIIEGRLCNQKDTYTVEYKKVTGKQDHAYHDGEHAWGPCRSNEVTNTNKTVYNLEVEIDNSYTANNIVVHNCQSFSFAGKGLGFEDPRGQLFFVFDQIIKYYNPKYFLGENVVMKKEYSDKISEYLGVECKMINSALLSAQNRKRLYWTNFPITIPEDKNIYWKDVKDNNVSIEQYYYTDKGLAWLAQHSHNRDKQLKTFEEDNSKMQMLEASHQKLYSSQRFFGIPDIPLDNEQVAAMRGRRISFNGNRTDSDYTIPITQYLEFRYDNKTNCLTTVSKDNVVVPFTIPNRIPASEFFFRYLTINECEKLQTFPIGYCSILSKSQAYKAIGNSWTVDVIAHIFECMKLYN